MARIVELLIALNALGGIATFFGLRWLVRRPKRLMKRCAAEAGVSPFPRPPLETMEKGLGRDREQPGAPADG